MLQLLPVRFWADLSAETKKIEPILNTAMSVTNSDAGWWIGIILKNDLKVTT
jgi:hypothetical protein